MNLWKASTVVLFVALACVIGRGAINTASAEPQPQMMAALNHLERAKAALENATLDKGGHRLRAIELTEGAMAQIREVIEEDNKR